MKPTSKVFYDEDARARVLAGAELLYNAVKTTLGPKGRNVVIKQQFGPPITTHDGVTVAKNVNVEETDDTLGYGAGAEIIKHASTKMNDVAGDGTTTVTVLTYHILAEASKLIAAGHNPMLIRKGLEMAAKEALLGLSEFSEDIAGNNARVAQVGTISAGDPSIGTLIAGVIEKIGKDGVVTVEHSKGMELESEVVEGFNFDRGFISPYMITDAARMEVVYDKAAIILCDYKLASIQEVFPMVEKLAVAGKKEVLIIAEDVEGEALGMLVINKLKGQLNVVCVKAPAFGDRRKEILKDIAILTGAQVFSADEGIRMDNPEATIDMCGGARRIIVGREETTIIEGGGAPEDVEARVKEIQQQIKNATSEYDSENLVKRSAALENKVAVIKVGGVTETEIEEKKFRVDDAVAAVKAALADGIVAGGGVTLVNLKKVVKVTHTDPAVQAGIGVLIAALEQPFRTLLTNSGLTPEAWLPAIEAEGSTSGFGINVNEPSVLVDMKEQGVIDPTRVTKEALQNAVSIAGTALTMGALIVELPPKDMPGQQQMMNPMMGGM